jgi:hypothetical protein
MGLDPITSLLNVGNSLIDRLVPDKTAAAAAKAQLVELQVQGQLDDIKGQLAIDQQEAASQSVFVAGWRPFIGWTCGSALAVDFIVRPFIMWACALLGHPVDFPSLDMSELMPLVLAMLGMGALHVTQDVMNKQTAAKSN